MIPAAFEYAAPTSVDEAISLLQQHGDEAKILAGGHSLLPLMKLRLATPGILVDLSRIPNLSYIREDGNQIAIGAMTPYVDIVNSDLLKGRIPILPESASMVGDPQVRNRGTLGGAVAHADPAGDMPAVVCAIGGQVVARGPNGDRRIDVSEFFQDIFTSALAADEVLTEVRLNAPQNVAQNYQKFRRRAIDWAIVGAAVNVVRSNGSIGSASVVLTNVGPTPVRADAVAQALQGQPATAETIAQAAEAADQGIEPTAELNASPDYKKHLARVLTRRALAAALGVG